MYYDSGFAAPTCPCSAFPISPRLKKGKELRKQRDIQEVKQSIHLIKSPAAGKFEDLGTIATWHY